jgi:O-acetyl-ADP-ribose deacetylase (regulator of RNase III)
MKYKEIKGDLIELAEQGMFQVIAHGCNCFCRMGAGIAPQMAAAFDCDKFPMEREHPGNINKLGNIDYAYRLGEYTTTGDIPDEDYFYIVNAYTQYKYGRNHVDGVENPFDYEAFTLCMRKINHRFKGRHIGLPQIGAGLAGGDWNKIKKIIQEELSECDVTVVIYDK